MDAKIRMGITALAIDIVLFVMILICAVLLTGCNEEVCRPVAWLTVGPDLDASDNPVTGRIGISNADGIEFGAESTWYGSEAQGYGAYALQEFEAINRLLPLGTTEYIGGHAAIIDTEDTGNTYGFIAGTSVPVRGNIETVVEYQFNEYEGALQETVGSDDAHKVFAGLRIKF